MTQVLFLIKRMMLICLLSYFVLLLNGCAKTTPFDDVWESSLKNCSNNCHSPSGTGFDLQLGPDMSTQDKFYDNLVGKTVGANYSDWAAVRTGDCDNVQLIKAGDAANSLVVASLVQSTADSLAASENCTIAISLHINQNVTTATDTWSELVKWINDGASKE